MPFITSHLLDFNDEMQIQLLRGETRVFPLENGRSDWTLVVITYIIFNQSIHQQAIELSDDLFINKGLHAETSDGTSFSYYPWN